MIDSILHPTDLIGNDAAFLHALRIALGVRGDLCILYSQSLPIDEVTEWHSFPGVRTALARWGLIESGAPQSAVARQLGVGITKAEFRHADPVNSVLSWLRDHTWLA
jgi:hypothetical protein